MVVFRYSPRSFVRALDANVFGERNVELIGGVLHDITTHDPRHIHAVERVAASLRASFPAARWTIFETKYARLGSWMPRPDATVLRLPCGEYLPRVPLPEDIRLVAEVSDAGDDVVSGLKHRKYASVGIPEYWIVDLDARRIRVSTDPTGAGKSACYRTASDYDESMIIPPPADAIEGVAVADVLPPGWATP